MTNQHFQTIESILKLFEGPITPIWEGYFQTIESILKRRKYLALMIGIKNFQTIESILKPATGKLGKTTETRFPDY
ncbi:hypothetical protein KTG15_06060 [Methanobacterium sp. YSL]|nr:hypothetical protein [Methanobacterium sp. YSL]